jgi:hypothetical protein
VMTWTCVCTQTALVLNILRIVVLQSLWYPLEGLDHYNAQCFLDPVEECNTYTTAEMVAFALGPRLFLASLPWGLFWTNTVLCSDTIQTAQIQIEWLPSASFEELSPLLLL